MSTPPIHFTPSPGSIPTISSARSGTRLWEWMVSPSGYGGLFKILGIVTVIGLTALAYKAYRSRPASQEPPPQKTFTDNVEPLPHGIKQEKIDACMKFIAENREDGLVAEIVGPTNWQETYKGFQVRIDASHLQDFTRGIPGQNYDVFLGYLVEKKLIKSYKTCIRTSLALIWL